MESKYRLLENGECDDGDTILSAAQTSRSWQPFIHWRWTKASPKTKQVHQCMNILGNLLVYLLALLGFINIVQQLHVAYQHHHKTFSAHSHRLEGCDCGDTVAEAILLGCKFDALSMAWLPEHCRDDELTAEFDRTGKGPNGTWIYYADTKHTVEVDVAEVAEMGDDPSKRVHMDKDWHQLHCYYYWLKLHRTRSNGKIIEPRSDTEAHIRHCGMVFREPGYGTISGVALNTNEAVAE